MVLNDETSDSGIVSPRDYMSSDSDWDMKCGDGRVSMTASSHHGYPLRYQQAELLTSRPASVGCVWTADNVKCSRGAGEAMPHLAAVYGDARPSDDLVGATIGEMWADIVRFNPCDVNVPTLTALELEAMAASANASAG